MLKKGDDFMEMPFCSIMITHYNGKGLLKECLGSLEKINYPKDRMEVILIDNASSDGSAEYVRKNFGWVKVFEMDKNYGFAGGLNIGSEKAKGDYLVILDNDTKVDREWLMEMVKVAKSDGKIGMCGSMAFDQALNAYTGLGALNVLGISRIETNVKELRECFWLTGCSFLIKRSVLKRLGYLFDPDFFAYFEETELCWRVRLLGYKIFYVPTSTLYHRGSVTAKKMGNIRKFWHYRNKIWSYKKNLRAPLKQLSLVPVFFITSFMIFRWSLTREWGYGVDVLGYIFKKFKKNPVIDRVSLKDQLRLFFV